MKEHKWAEVLIAIAEGKEAQYRHEHTDGEWRTGGGALNPISCEDWEWRIKPAKKAVDLSVLIKSGIDCEFWSGNKSKNIHKLMCISNKDYKAKGRKYYNKCRPRMDNWHSWQGGDCPLPEGFIIDVTTRDNRILKGKEVQDLRWGFKKLEGDIIAFKVIGLAEGWCYPWQVEE